MIGHIPTRARKLALLSLVALAAACTPPRSGPSMSEIFAGSVEREGDAYIIAVNRAVARTAAQVPSMGFSKALQRGAILGGDTIQPGDVVTLNVFENVPEGLLASPEVNNAILTDVQVDDAGFVFVPYAGRIRAAGRTPDALRRTITAALDEQTPDPQVLVSREQGDGTTVSVMGDVNAQGVFPIERPTRRITAMIAAAGGVSVPADQAVVRLTRGNRQESAFLRDIYEVPHFDIALRGGDRLLVEADRRAFTVLGATGTSSRLTFEAPVISAVEAIAMVGGLDPLRADPKGVFVFRDEPEEMARAILGRQDMFGEQRFVYVLDLTAPNGMFNARDFKIRDGDTVFVTEASSVTWSRQIASLTGALAAAGSVQSLADGTSD